MKQFRDYREAFVEELRGDPSGVETYLEVALEEFEEDGGSEALLLALHTVAETQKSNDL